MALRAEPSSVIGGRLVSNFEFQAFEGSDAGRLFFKRNRDPRGWLAEIFNQADVSALGLPVFGQDNTSFTDRSGQIRGLHFQTPPHAQAKLFRVVSGSATQVLVDLRPPSFGQTITLSMTHADDFWLYAPEGFAHGFQTESHDVILHYKLSAPFCADALGSVHPFDAKLAIAWPIACAQDWLSARDRGAGSLEAVRGTF